MDCRSSLQDDLTNAKLILSMFETKLAWEPPSVEKATELIVCPVDGGHRIPRAKSGSHTSSCRWRKLGYSREHIKEILDQEERTKAQNDTIIINSDSIISEIAPSAGLIRSNELYKANLNPSQRLAVYEAEVLQCYSSQKSLPDKALYADLEAKAAEKLYQQENPENLSEVELLQKLRDMKRRRQSYRAKNVHITKRSQTEILRGVLKVHMEELEKMWNPKEQELDDTGNSLVEGYGRKRGHSYDRKSSCSHQPSDSQRMHHQEESERNIARLSREPFRDYRKDDKSTFSKNAERSLISEHHKMGDSGMRGRDGHAGDAERSTKDLSRLDDRTYSRKCLEPSKAVSISKEKLHSFSTVSLVSRSYSSNSDEDDHKKHKHKKKKSKKHRHHKKEK